MGVSHTRMREMQRAMGKKHNSGDKKRGTGKVRNVEKKHGAGKTRDTDKKRGVEQKRGTDKVRATDKKRGAAKACKANISGKACKASEAHGDARPALSEPSVKVKVCKKCCGVSAKKLNRELGADVCAKGCMGACSRRVRERCGTGVCARMGKRLVFAEDATALARTICAA